MEGRKLQGQLAVIQVIFFTILIKIARLAAATTIAAQWQATLNNLFLLIVVPGEPAVSILWVREWSQLVPPKSR
jgi:hypothetical protein